MARTERRATLVDSNVLLDVITGDPDWGDWSARALSEAAGFGATVINAIVFAEVSVRFSAIEDLQRALPASLERTEIPWPAAFLAGKAHGVYRRRGGQRPTTLPDFFIGAHAAVSGLRLLTRDARRYGDYFPTVELVAP